MIRYFYAEIHFKINDDDNKFTEKVLNDHLLGINWFQDDFVISKFEKDIAARYKRAKDREKAIKK